MCILIQTSVKLKKDVKLLQGSNKEYRRMLTAGFGEEFRKSNI